MHAHPTPCLHKVFSQTGGGGVMLLLALFHYSCEQHIVNLISAMFVYLIAWFVVIFGVNTTRDISKFETILKYHEVFMPNITYKSWYYLFILLPVKGL